MSARAEDQNHETCSILCITKVFLFTIITLFVLYLPLGDPQIICDARDVLTNRKGLICLCDVFNFVKRMAEYSVDTVDQLVCVVKDALYEGKLQLYTVLSTFDRDDYCRVASCSSNPDEDDIQEKPKYCRCKNSKCRRR